MNKITVGFTKTKECATPELLQKIGLGKEKYFKKYKLSEGILAEDFTYDKLVFAKDSEIGFYESGKIKVGTFVKTGYVLKRRFDTGTFIWFKENGSIDFCRP